MADSTRRRTLHRVSTMLMLAGLTACGGDTSGNEADKDLAAMAIGSADSAAAMSTASTMANAALDDTSVVHLISAVDRGEAAAGEMAMSKATHGDVKAYARMMMQEHQAGLTTLRGLATATGITLDTTDATRADGDVPGVAGAQNASGAASTNGAVIQLQQNMQQTMSRLQLAAGADFDRQFIASQLTGHRQVLDLLQQNESRLQNAQIRAHVAAVMVAMTKHRDRARGIQQQIGSDSFTTAPVAR